METLVRTGGYPISITIRLDRGGEIDFDHRDILALEHAVANAKRAALSGLPRNLWHEIDPTLAGK